MAAQGREGRRLNATLVDLTDLLIGYGVDEWGYRLRGDRSAFERGHEDAFPRLRASLIGPGSLEEVTIDPAAGHDVAPGDVEKVNARMQDLRATCAELLATLSPTA